ncbi:MAG: hypothetical protein ACREUY_02760 [Burkholderiales bacterium]
MEKEIMFFRALPFIAEKKSFWREPLLKNRLQDTVTTFVEGVIS